MSRLREWTSEFGLRALLVLGIGWFYLWTAVPVWTPGLVGPAGQGYYNLLMRGFTKGHLSLDLPADPALATMRNPSDPAERGDHGLHDASYYRGRYYLYFGAAPVFLLFLPFHEISGRYIDETLAAPLFSLLGFLASVGLILAVRRRYFPKASWLAAAGCVAALGLADMLPILLRRSNVWEVPITCAYACYMVGLWLLYQSLHADRSAAWLAGASAAFGLAVASRPTYLFGCGAVLVPVAYLLWGRRKAALPGARGRVAPLLVAAVVPLGAIGLLMALYNFSRFGSVTDFGFRHLMNGEPVWKEDLFGLRFFWFNLRVYLFAPAHWVPYFPYVSVARLPAPPAGHLGAEDPYGVLPNMPLAFVAVWVAARALPADGWAAPLRAFCVAVLVGTVGTGLATTSFGGAINRYEVDFVPGLIVLACVGWLALAQSAGRATRLLLLLAASFSMLFNVLASLRHNELLRAEHAALYRRLAHAWNAPSQVVARWLGVSYGPLELTVVFPQDKVGQIEPLVVTGVSFMSDYLVVHYEARDRLRFALEHTSYGHFIGPPIAFKPGEPHVIKVEMGSLYPPPEHPFFDGLDPVAVQLCPRTLRVTLDGRIALERDLPFYDAASLRPSIGSSGDRPAFPKPFSGRLVSWRTLPVDLVRPEVGPALLSVQFPPFTGVRGEPLVSSGAPGKGDLVFVRYLGPDTVCFGWDHPGAGATESSPIAVDYSAAHRVEIDAQQLRAGAGGPTPDERGGHMSLKIDGKTVFFARHPYYACRPETVSIGLNPIASSASVEMFRGQILETRRLGASTLDSPEAHYGPIDLQFRMPEAATQAQPLVSSGRPGSGDALWVRWVAPGRARLGYDHWGAGVVESPEFSLAADAPHVVHVSMPSLLSPGATPLERLLRGVLSVSIDGKPVWARRVAFHPAAANEAYFGSNAIQASSCASDFSRGISWFERSPEAAVPAKLDGPVVAQLTFPDDKTGQAEPLVTVGRPGRADVLLVRYLDGARIGFAIDHWGASYTESAPVALDYGRPHTLVISMPNLVPSAGSGDEAGEVVVRVDGAEVWRRAQRFYRCDTPAAIAVNPIGASTCGAEFTGCLASITSLPDLSPSP